MLHIVCLPVVEQQLSPKERQEIESRLANYHIPLHILQIIAEECKCGDVIEGRRETRVRVKGPSLISRLNDEALIQLRQIFLDCEDSFSRFRFAVILSSKFTPALYKFVMTKKIQGISQQEYVFDVCVYSRATEDLVATGMQNNNTGRKAADARLLHDYLGTIRDVLEAYPTLRSAYYSSSYGYDCHPSRLAKMTFGNDVGLEINFLEFKDMVYRQVRER